ncbi:MAG: pyridoxal phosphate-dependent aminotransferase [Thermoplasmata archaeon]|nr:pyridoxal phosphate-dependent aminotransferase [Thermoplasmata archaeon]
MKFAKIRGLGMVMERRPPIFIYRLFLWDEAITMKHLAGWTDTLPLSGTMEISRMAGELMEKGRNILSLSIGEPDFPTPSHIVEAAVESLRKGETHYTPAPGIPELRAAVADTVRENNNIDVSPEEVFIVPAKQAIFSALHVLVDSGEVLYLEPAWVSYGPQIMLSGGRPRPVAMKSSSSGFMLDEEAVKEAVGRDTRAIIINTPSNPTGCVLSERELKFLADVAVDNDLYVVADEIYERLVYEGRHVSIASLPDMKDRTITVSGFSKSYAMTGWRIGWAAGPKKIIDDMIRLQQHTLTCLPMFIQKGGLAALTGPQEPVEEMKRSFKRRRDMLLSLLDEIPGMEVARPRG